MKIGYLQFEPEFGNISKNVETVRSMLDEVSADLIVLPELFNSGYYITENSDLHNLGESIPDGFTTLQLVEIARQKQMHIVAGILENDNGTFYNSAVLVGPGGYIDTYRKIHLYFEEKLWFAPGNKPFKVYNIGEANIGIMICYDWIYPESMRVLALLGADVICHCTNLVMPYCPGIMPSRCFDNKVFSITANRTGKDVRGEKSLAFIGQSLICSPKGEVIKISGPESREVVVVEINPADARNKNVNAYNDLFIDRRPEFYGTLTMTADELADFQPRSTMEM